MPYGIGTTYILYSDEERTTKIEWVYIKEAHATHNFVCVIMRTYKAVRITIIYNYGRYTRIHQEATEMAVGRSILHVGHLISGRQTPIRHLTRRGV